VAVGDVNGDGIGDLIIGAPLFHSPYGIGGTGAVFVVFGKSGAWSGTATPLNSTFLNGPNGFNGAEFDGIGGNAGNSVAAGDVNGDGRDDIIIGAPNARSGLGSVYVVFGASPLLPQTTVTTTIRSYTATVASANGLVVGETVTATSIPAGTTISAISGNTLTLSNKATGTASGMPLYVTPALNSAFLNGINGIELDGMGGNMGLSVAAGDVNGDGIADIVIDAPIANAGTGSVYVVFGASPLLPQTTVTTTKRSSTATVASAAGLFVGETVTSTYVPAGTTITAISGTTLTLSNTATATASAPLYVSKVTLDRTFLNGINGAEFDGPAGANAGSSVAVGDVNGDGIGDLIIGATGTSACYSYSRSYPSGGRAPRLR
jgi:hypothetical protein